MAILITQLESPNETGRPRERKRDRQREGYQGTKESDPSKSNGGLEEEKGAACAWMKQIPAAVHWLKTTALGSGSCRNRDHVFQVFAHLSGSSATVGVFALNFFVFVHPLRPSTYRCTNSHLRI